MAVISIRLTCPICGTRERMPAYGPLKTWQKQQDGSLRVSIAQSVPKLVAAAASLCPECNSPFGILVYPGSMTISSLFSSSTNDEVDSGLHGSVILTVPAGPEEIVTDESLPEKIRQHFVIIQEDAKRRRNAPGILSGARGCLDVALKSLGEEKGGRRDRINNLAKKGLITLGIAQWAQTLWEEGSDAVHDLDADIDRAIEHVTFLKLFFEVAFILPARIQKASHIAADGGE